MQREIAYSDVHPICSLLLCDLAGECAICFALKTCDDERECRQVCRALGLRPATGSKGQGQVPSMPGT